MDVHAPNHLTSWFLFAAGAGATNAGAFLGARRFVSHVTGTATDLAMSLSDWRLYVDIGVIIVAFVAGAMASVLAVDRPKLDDRPPRYGAALMVVALLIAGVAVVGNFGLFGAFGEESPRMLGMAALLAFAMGLQNATVAAATGLAVRTTHLTGPSTDLGVFMGRWLIAREQEQRRAARRDGWLRFGKVVSFIGGALAMVFLASRVEFVAFFAPAAAIVIATLLTFEVVPSARRVSV